MAMENFEQTTTLQKCQVCEEYEGEWQVMHRQSRSVGVGPGIVWEKWLLRFSEHHEGCGGSGSCLVCVVEPLGHLGEAG